VEALRHEYIFFFILITNKMITYQRRTTMAKYMVLYVNKEDGLVEAAYKADVIGELDGPADDAASSESLEDSAARPGMIETHLDEDTCRIVMTAFGPKIIC